MGVHITGFFVSMIVILATTKNKNSTSYVFTNFDNTSGWQSNGVSFLIGLLSTVYGFVGIEQPTHYAEEIKHVTKNLPRACVCPARLLSWPNISNIVRQSSQMLPSTQSSHSRG